MDFAVPVDPGVKLKESEKENQYLNLARELKNVKHESDVCTNCNYCFSYGHEKIDSRTGGLGNKRTNDDHPNYSIIKIGQNTEKSSGDLRTLLSSKLQRKTICWCEKLSSSNYIMRILKLSGIWDKKWVIWSQPGLTDNYQQNKKNKNK